MEQISAKIYGNPIASNGFKILQAEGFIDEEFKYERQGGVQNDFYSFIIKPTQTIYTYSSKNVNSVGGSRGGSLLIAISIPKGYKIDGGVTPYDVLNKIRDEIRIRCLVNKGGGYEYKEEGITPGLLKSILNNFRLIQHLSPHFVMSPNGGTGVITLGSELQYPELFNDVQYAELKTYKEVLVTLEKVNNPLIKPVQGIEIPRKPNYTIKVDGLFKEYIKDTNKINSYQANKNQLYYNTPVISFTIAELITNPNKYSNVQLDQANEVIHVTTVSSPKKVDVVIRIQDQLANNYFRSIRSKLYVKFNGVHSSPKKEITDQLTFSLIGEELKYLETPNAISLSCTETNNYKIKASTLAKGVKGYELHVVVEKVPQKTSSKQLVSNKNMNQSTDDFALIQLRNQLEESNKKIKKLERKNNILLIIGIVACILVGFGTWGIPKIFGEENKSDTGIDYQYDVLKDKINQLNKCLEQANEIKSSINKLKEEAKSSKEDIKKSAKQKLETLNPLGKLAEYLSDAKSIKREIEKSRNDELTKDAERIYDEINNIKVEVERMLETNSLSNNDVDNGDDETESVIPEAQSAAKKAAEAAKKKDETKKAAEAAKKKDEAKKAADAAKKKEAEAAKNNEDF